MLKPMLCALAALLSLSSVPAQLVIEDVAYAVGYREATLTLSLTPEGTEIHYVLAPLSAFEVVEPDTLILPVSEGGSTVLTAVYTTVGGIRMIIQTPCDRYPTIALCVEAHSRAIAGLQDVFPVDAINSKKDTHIVIPRVGKE